MKGESTIPAYELRYICIGNEVVDARPVQWNGKDYTGQGRDKDGNIVMPTVYCTVCPKCAQQIQFGVDEIRAEEDKERVICSNCQAGTKEMEAIKQTEVDHTKRVEGLKKTIEKAYEPDIGAKTITACPQCQKDDWKAEGDKLKCTGCGLLCYPTSNAPTTCIDETPAQNIEIPQEVLDQISEPPEPKQPEQPKVEGDEIEWFEDPIATGKMKIE